MNKRILSGVLALSMVLGVTTPVRSQAAVGLISLIGGGGGIPLIKIGGAIAAAGAFTFYADMDYKGGYGEPKHLAGWIGLLGVIIGLVVLDENGSVDTAFTSVSAEQAKTLGFTEQEYVSFNSEVEEVNVISQSISQSLRQSSNPTVDQAKDLWNESRALVSPETFNAVVKISQKAMGR